MDERGGLVGTSVIPECAFVADADLGCWTDVRIADGTAAVVAFAETAYGDACLAATHDEIGIVLGHGDNNTGVRELRAELVKISEFWPEFFGRNFRVGEEPYQDRSAGSESGTTRGNRGDSEDPRF